MRARIAAVLMLALILILSCSTINRSEIPDWVLSQPRILGSVVFVGTGTGTTLDEARGNAYDDVLEKMSSNLGRNLSSIYLRELMSRGTISDLSTTVDGEYYAMENGQWKFYVMTVTPSRSFRDSRSPEYIELLEREKRIENKINEAISLYSENKDIDAIDRIIDAIEISLEGNVNNPEYTENALLDKAIEYISRIRIKVSKPKNGEVSVKVTRARGILHPAVVDGYIYSQYNAVNSDGAIITAGFVSKTEKNGRFLFNRTDPYMLRSSLYRFSPYIDREKLHKIEEKAGNDFLVPLYDAIESVSETYEYSYESRISSDSYVIAISVYDIAGTQLDNSIIENTISDQLSKAGINDFKAVYGYGDVSEDTYEMLLRLFPDCHYYFILRTGIVDRVDAIDKIYARAEAIFSLYDGNGNEIKSYNYYTSGEGKSFEEASETAFKNIARIISGFLLEEL